MASDRTKKTVAGGLAGAVALALTLAVAGLKPDEGKRNVTYLDVAKVPTICYGHTGRDVKPGQRRSDGDCEALLTVDARRHLGGVLACSPELATRPNQLAAATRLAFNIGTGAYCSTDSAKSRSAIARHFQAERWRAGCDGFLAWRFAAGRPILLKRRERERALCLTGVS